MQRSPSRNNAQKFNVERNERNSSASATPPLAPLSLADDVAELCFKRTVEFRAADRNVAVVMLHGYSQIVPLTSLRRVGEQTP